MAEIKKNHAVKFNQYGGVEVLTIQETLIPALGPTQVLVRVKADRIDTIIDFEAAKKYGVKTAGNSEGGKPEVLAELAGLIDAGKLQIPIAAVYRLTDVRDAYRELAKHHTHGEVVLVP
jgi:NADPH:quinone reductase-like Zn-dependent oxidoreductase